MNPSRAPGITDVGPQTISAGGPTVQGSVASVPAEAPTKTVPAGPTSEKDCQRVVPVFVRTKSSALPRDV